MGPHVCACTHIVNSPLFTLPFRFSDSTHFPAHSFCAMLKHHSPSTAHLVILHSSRFLTSRSTSTTSAFISYTVKCAHWLLNPFPPCTALSSPWQSQWGLHHSMSSVFPYSSAFLQFACLKKKKNSPTIFKLQGICRHKEILWLHLCSSRRSSLTGSHEMAYF